MTVQETAQLLGLWLSEPHKPSWESSPQEIHYPETILLGGMEGLAKSITKGFSDYPEIGWQEWKELAKPYLKCGYKN